MRRDRNQLAVEVEDTVARLRALAADVRDTHDRVLATDLYTAVSLAENVSESLADLAVSA